MLSLDLDTGSVLPGSGGEFGLVSLDGCLAQCACFVGTLEFDKAFSSNKDLALVDDFALLAITMGREPVDNSSIPVAGGAHFLELVAHF